MTNQGMFNWILFNTLVLYLPVAAIVVWRKPLLWRHLLALFLGSIVGWWDMKSTEVSITVLLLLTLGFFLGFANPKRAWLTAILLGAGIPLFAQLGVTLQLTTLTPIEQVTSFLALIFSFGGTYAGVLVRRRVPREQLQRAFESP